MRHERIPGQASTRRYSPAEKEQVVRLVRTLRAERLKALEQENEERKRANEMAASADEAAGGPITTCIPLILASPGHELGTSFGGSNVGR